MIYNDGFPMDDNLRLSKCPKCENEQFSDEADFCRICGTHLYNFCEGEDKYHYNGDFSHHEEHKNHGNARYCETCGRPTRFLKEHHLLPYNEVREEIVEHYLTSNPSALSGEEVMIFEEEDDDVPF